MFCQAPVHCVVSNSTTESASLAAAEAVDLLFGLLSACLTLHQHSHIAAAIFYFMYWSTALYVQFSSHLPGWIEEGYLCFTGGGWEGGNSTISSHLKIRLQGLVVFPASLCKVTGLSEDCPPQDNIEIYTWWDSLPSGCTSLPVDYSQSQSGWTLTDLSTFWRHLAVQRCRPDT